jgi:hypothetical protein
VTITLYATTEKVAVAWIASIPGLTAAGVGTQLPAAETEWGSADGTPGYVVVPVTVGGTPMANAPVQRPVVQVECWATIPGSDYLPWNAAAQLPEQIRMATYDRSGAFSRLLDLGPGYPSARVLAATILTQPRRVWSDEGDYAGFLFNLMLQFVAAGEEIQ